MPLSLNNRDNGIFIQKIAQKVMPNVAQYVQSYVVRLTEFVNSVIF